MRIRHGESPWGLLMINQWEHHRDSYMGIPNKESVWGLPTRDTHGDCSFGFPIWIPHEEAAWGFHMEIACGESPYNDSVWGLPLGNQRSPMRNEME